MKTVVYVSVVQIISWILFMLTDFIEEIMAKNSFSIFCFYIVYLFLLIIPILYFKFEKKLNMQKLKLFILFISTWIFESLIIGLNIWNLVNYNNWIIRQNRDGIFNLNGIEYYIFTIILTFLPILIIVIVKLIKFIYKKVKETK